MNKKTIAGAILLVVGLSLIAYSHAELGFEKYKLKDRHLELKKAGEGQIELEVIQNSDECVTDCYAIIKATPKKPFTFPPSPNGKFKVEIEKAHQASLGLREYNIYVQEETLEPRTKEEIRKGEQIGTYANGTPIYEWVEIQKLVYDKKKVWSKNFWGKTYDEPFLIKIEGKKSFTPGKRNAVDWIPTIYNIRIPEWLLWDGAVYNSYVIPELNNSATFGLRDHPVKGVFQCFGDGCAGGYITVLLNNGTELQYGSRVLNSSNNSHAYIEYSFKIPRFDKETTNTSIYIWFDTNASTYNNITWETAFYNYWEDFESATLNRRVPGWATIAGGGPYFNTSNVVAHNGSRSGVAQSAAGTDLALSTNLTGSAPVKVRARYWLYADDGTGAGGLLRFTPSSDNGSLGTLDMAAHSDLDSVCTDGSRPCWTGNTDGTWKSRQENVPNVDWNFYEIILNSTDDRLHYRINESATDLNNDMVEAGAVSNITILAMNVRASGNGNWFIDDLAVEFLPRINILSNTYSYFTPPPATINFTGAGDNSSGTEPKHLSDTNTFALWQADKNLDRYWSEHNATGFFVNTSVSSFPASNWSNISINTNLSSTETFAWRIFANDTEGNENNTGWNFVTVQNTAPSFTATTINPTVPTTGQDLYCNGTATDPDSTDTLTGNSRWFRDGVLQFTLSKTVTNGTSDNISVILSGNTSVGEVWLCEAWAGDGTDTSARSNDSVTIQNSAPTLEATASAPATVKTADDWYTNATVADADADSLQGCVRYFVDGGIVDEWCKNVANNTNTNLTRLKSGNFSKAEVLTAEIYGTDGTTETARTNLTETVANTAPTTPELNAPPNNSRQTGNLVNLSWSNVTDADGDAITFHLFFEISSPPAHNASSTAAAIERGTQDGTTYYWQVLASDGTDNSSTSNEANFTENTAPSVNVTITPDFITELVNMSCNVTDSDADGDTVTISSYEWVKNGVAQSIDSENLTFGNTTIGETWYCYVNATDGYEPAIYNSSNVTILNSVFFEPTWIRVLAYDELNASALDFNLSITNGSLDWVDTDTVSIFYFNHRNYDHFDGAELNTQLWSTDTEGAGTVQVYQGQLQMNASFANGQTTVNVTPEREVQSYMEWYHNTSEINGDETKFTQVLYIHIYNGRVNAWDSTGDDNSKYVINEINSTHVQLWKSGTAINNFTGQLNGSVTFQLFVKNDTSTGAHNITLDYVRLDNSTGFTTGYTDFTVSRQGYESRNYYEYVNQNENKTLFAFLLDEDEGEFISIRVRNESYLNVKNATVVISRLIAGNWSEIYSEATDTSGTVVPFLDTSQVYRINVTHPSYAHAVVDKKFADASQTYIITLGTGFQRVLDDLPNLINISITGNFENETINVVYNDTTALTEWVQVTVSNYTNSTQIIYSVNTTSPLNLYVYNASKNSSYTVNVLAIHPQFNTINVTKLIDFSGDRLFGLDAGILKWISVFIIIIVMAVFGESYGATAAVAGAFTTAILYGFGWFDVAMTATAVSFVVIIAIANHMLKRRPQ